ncbi:Non-specific serine/threonine protein kinase [Forsythia ovata]|uniref:Non-specific serine/threonine protein kinase n=1 Tax=Forsythia ovata TaxID=205694 RepID=A0ABD1TN61_9LAMI
MVPLKSNAFTLLLISLLATSAAVLAANIPLGSTLYASDPNSKWTLPNSTTLSFITDPVDPTSGASLFATITFNSIPIWKASGSSASVNSSAVFRLVASSDLQLLHSSTFTTLVSLTWCSNAPATRPPLSPGVLDVRYHVFLMSPVVVPIALGRVLLVICVTVAACLPQPRSGASGIGP